MIVQPSDITYILSGGIGNSDPNASLGGEPSGNLCDPTSLFDDVTTDEANSGYIAYRCFYIFNDNESDTLFDCQLFLSNLNPDGSQIQIGVNTPQNDIQQITIQGPQVGGTFTLNFDGYDVLIYSDLDHVVYAQNIQNALNELDDLGDAIVGTSAFSGILQFQIDFAGTAGHRFQPLMTLVSNDLFPIGHNTITIGKIQNGGPLNSIATEIDVETTPPNNITFTTPLVAAILGATGPILIGDLRPLDGFPIWIQRNTPAGIGALSGDGFTLNFQGFPIGVGPTSFSP